MLFLREDNGLGEIPELPPVVLRMNQSTARLAEIRWYISGTTQSASRPHRCDWLEGKAMLTHSDLPRSAIIILDHLSEDGPLSPHQISHKTRLPTRTVSFALQKLIGQKLCRRIPNLQDMRKPLYLVDDQRARDLKAQIDRLRAESGLIFRPR